MSEKQRISLDYAKALASEIVELLAPACARIEVAGSIRREKEMVGDVEIVCAPRVRREVQLDLFGGESEQRAFDELDELCERLLTDGVFSHRLSRDGKRAWGAKMKRTLYAGVDPPVPLDIFAVTPPAQFGALFTIRTGPSDFSHALVTSQARGGAMPPGMWQDKGALWKRGKIVETPTEEDYFAALGLPWIPPQERTVERLREEIRRASAVGALKT